MTTLRKPNAVDLTLLTITMMIWALAFISIKVAVPSTGPIWLAAFRVSIGFVVLLPFALWSGLTLPKSAKQWRLLIAMAMLNVVIPFMLINFAELSVTAGVATLLMGTGPFLALVGSHFFTSDDKFTLRKLSAVMLGFCGVVLIVGVDAVTNLGSGNLIAQGALVLASVCYVTSGLLVRRIEIPPLSLATLALGFGSLALWAIALITSGDIPLHLSGTPLYAVIFLGVLPTGVAYILRFHLIGTIGYSMFALGVNLIPVFGVFLAFLLLGEPLEWHILVALVLIVSGLFVARAAPTKASETSAKAA